MDEDIRSDLQKIAYQQQAAHLARAQNEAFPRAVENRLPVGLRKESAMAYYVKAKRMLGERRFVRLRSLMRKGVEPNPDGFYIFSEITRLLINYPDLMKAFGMFLPPRFNLAFQSGVFLHLHQTVSTDKQAAAVVKGESKEMPSTSSNEQMMEIPPSNEIDSNLSQDDSFDKREPNSWKEMSEKRAKSFLSRVEDRFKEEPHIYRRYTELLNSLQNDSLCDQIDIGSDVLQEVLDLFHGHDDLIDEFKSFILNAVCESPEDLSKITVVNDPSIASVYKFGTYEEHLFFDKVRAAVGYEEVYINFLRCLNLFTEDLVTRSELLEMCTPFLGPYPELLKQFKDMLRFKENGDNIEAIPQRIVDLENRRNEIENAADIDFSAGGRNGVSYQALPKDFEHPKCSGRTALCDEVLNDTWVSFPAWSEDFNSVASRKNRYENIIHRCEEERFELDMAISANTYTYQILENLQKSLIEMSVEEKSAFKLDDYLGGTSTVIQRKALHRIYGDKTEELIKGLKRNPFLALPIVLKRMKLKEDEWKEHQKKFNVIWKNQINKNYLKSLDHQGIQFEQNDFKSFHPENLLNEIEMIYAENKNKQTNSKTHFILEFKEAEVFLDVINLMLQHLKKLPEVSRDDRHKIELVVRSFIPDIFCAPRSTKIDNALEIDEENKGEPIDVDNDSGERSGQHSSVGSSKDEGEVFSEVDSNEDYFSGESFIPKMNVFDKMDPLPVTNLPYTLFFVSKTWFVFFRQFHILFERLSKLLHESNYKEELLKRKGFIWIQEEETPKSSYKELIDGLNQLMSGAIDYSQFEEMARSHFGIHAYVSFTMDKLIHAIVGQLQQVVMDDLSKECTAIFIQHSKKISTSGCASPLKASQLEYKYLQRVEKMMDDEKFFKIIWHKKDCVLTIELLECEMEETNPDPVEAEKFSNYLDTFVTDDDCCEEFLTQVQQSPVFLPRNLRKQMLLWKNRVVQVEKQWQQKESTKYLKKHPPLSARKKRALSAISPLFSKKQRPSSIPEGSLHPPCSGMVPNNGNEPNNFDNSVSIKKKPVEEIFENYEELGSEENLNKTVVCVENQVDIKRKEDMEEPNIVIDPEKMVNCPINESVVIDAVAFSALNIRSEKLSPNSLSEIEDQDLKETFIKMTIKEKITDQALKETFVNVTIKEETSNEEVEKMEVDEKNSCTSVVSSVGEYVSVVEPGNASKDNISGKKTEDSMLRAIFLGSTDSNIDLISKIGTVIEVAHNTVGTIKTEESDFQTGDAKGKKQLKRKTTQKTYGCSTKRRKRTNRSYVKRKMKRGSPRSMLGNQRRQEKYKFEALDDPTFDFKYFSELPEIDKVSYLALKDVIIQDDEEVSFKIGSYKMHFVQNRELFLHRKDSLTRAQEIHQSVSEIKASNFNAWHRLWLYRYVTPSMFKYCNDWLLRSDPKKFKLMRVTVSDCTKPPYIPYYKYKVCHFKTVF